MNHAGRRESESPLTVCCVSIGLLFSLSPGVQAGGPDILVTVAGEHIETQGKWRVEGRQVLYTNLSGNLSSLRLSNVDLEASERASALQEAAVAEAPPTESLPEKEAVLVITDGDVARVRSDGLATASNMGIEIDISKLSESELGGIMKEALTLGTQIYELHQRYNLLEPAGARRAADGFEQIAEHWMARANGDAGVRREFFRRFSIGARQLAEMARNSPDALSRRFEQEWRRREAR